MNSFISLSLNTRILKIIWFGLDVVLKKSLNILTMNKMFSTKVRGLIQLLICIGHLYLSVVDGFNVDLIMDTQTTCFIRRRGLHVQSLLTILGSMLKTMHLLSSSFGGGPRGSIIKKSSSLLL